MRGGEWESPPAAGIPGSMSRGQHWAPLSRPAAACLSRRPLYSILFSVEVFIIEDIRGFRTEGVGRGDGRELEAESLTMGVRHGGGFGNCQWRELNTRGTPLPGEDVGRFVVNDTAYTMWGDVSRMRHVGEVGNNVEHPVSKARGCTDGAVTSNPSSSVSSRITWTRRSFSTIS